MRFGAITLVLATILAAAAAAQVTPPGLIGVQDTRFIDPEGREIVLHGISVISKNPADNYQSWHGAKEFALMRDWGLNCIRLGIIWDGLEPEPGQYDEAYLKKVDQRVAWAKEHGLYVLLDMHQDLFSVSYSDGAPEWATLTDGQPHVSEGGVWSDAYLTSAAIQRAFDNFWANTPGPGGPGIQDRFAQAWKHVAARYANEPIVLGYDLFNEPNIGSGNLPAQAAMIEGFVKGLAKVDSANTATASDIAAQWLDPAGRAGLMSQLSDMTIYTAVIDNVEAIQQEFERTKLMPMYERVTKAIREVDTDHIVFLETSMTSNMGVRTGIEPVRDANGVRDPKQAYAPHGYDIVVDTPALSLANPERVSLIFERHAEAARRLNMPTLVGEWGAYGSAGPEILPAARHMARQLERHGASDTYWEFGRYLLDAAYLEIVNRPVPQRLAGTLTAYETKAEAKHFHCTWQETPAVTAPSRIYIPAWLWQASRSVRLTPAGKGFSVEPVTAGSDNVVLVVPPTGTNAKRRIEVGGASPACAAT
ncbi:MAG: cellulase family glycosylhydrolase [Nitrospiraceae bacterium]|nr:cellulase family glycosylhydrolase [Nitrospiraceae bacterium]